MEKYTVIIPTRDRAETLEATLRTCLRQTYKNFEIIVSDNCSDDNTKEIVHQFKDSRITYINPGRRLSMSGNFEFSLGHVTDGFVMFIGSDDGIMPDAINYVNSIVEKYKVDAVSCRQATYVWPNFTDTTIAERLTFGELRTDVEIRSSDEWIKKTLSSPSMYCFQLPNLYCGFVHKRVIDKAYKDGRYFRSITPDAYSAFATAIFVGSYAFSFKPFSIAGASAKSNGASALHSIGDNKEVTKFYSENDIDFSEGFVNCPSFEIICVETFAQLAKAFPDRCLPYQIDYKTMLLQALENVNQKTVAEVSAAVAIMANNFSVSVEGRKDLLKVNSVSFLRKCRNVWRVIIGPTQVIEITKSLSIGVKDIDDAALVAHALMLSNDATVFVTIRGALFKRLKRMVGL